MFGTFLGGCCVVENDIIFYRQNYYQNGALAKGIILMRKVVNRVIGTKRITKLNEKFELSKKSVKDIEDENLKLMSTRKSSKDKAEKSFLGYTIYLNKKEIARKKAKYLSVKNRLVSAVKHDRDILSTRA